MGKYSEALHDGKDPVRIIVDAETNIKELEFTVRDTLVYAFRYALGRSSYCVNDVCIAISKHKDNIGDIAVSLIKKEIKEYLEGTPTGHIEEWKHLLKELEYNPKGYSMSTLEVPKTTKEDNE